MAVVREETAETAIVKADLSRREKVRATDPRVRTVPPEHPETLKEELTNVTAER